MPHSVIDQPSGSNIIDQSGSIILGTRRIVAFRASAQVDASSTILPVCPSARYSPRGRRVAVAKVPSSPTPPVDTIQFCAPESEQSEV
jgi:hypothetical protein